MIWNIAEFITLCINRKGIHPGVHIGLDLVLFVALLGNAAASFCVIVLIADAVSSYVSGQEGENAVPAVYTAATVFAILPA
jgi:hypothetical protein